MSASHQNAPHSTGAIGSYDKRIWQPSGLAFENAGFLAGEHHGNQRPSLSTKIRRAAAALENLAPDIDNVVTGLSGTYGVAAPVLIQDLQNSRSDIAYLTKLVHEQRCIIEGKDQEIRILSQKLSSWQSLVTDQANGNPATSPSPATSGTSSKAGL